MVYGIIGAMDEEIALLQAEMTDTEIIEIANSLFIKGRLAGQDVVLVKSGIGKVNAAMTTTILMERFKPRRIINTGSAGGFDASLNVGDIVISRAVTHHDVDVTAFDYVPGQVPGMPETFKADLGLIKQAEETLQAMEVNCKLGLIATGDAFMSDAARVDKVKGLFPEMIAAEMEAAAIAQVAYQYKTPFVVIRALSDIAGQEAPMSFNDFLKIAAENAAHFIIQMIRQ